MTPPWASLTGPDSVPVVIWAEALTASPVQTSAAAIRLLSPFLQIMSAPSPSTDACRRLDARLHCRCRTGSAAAVHPQAGPQSPTVATDFTSAFSTPALWAGSNQFSDLIALRKLSLQCATKPGDEVTAAGARGWGRCYHDRTLSAPFLALLSVLATALLLTGSPLTAQTQPGAIAYQLINRDGRRPLPARVIGNQDMFALDDLARMFELTVREDAAAGGVTVAARGQTIVLSAGQPLASVGGRLVSLSGAPVHEGRAWLVPADFISRALALALGTRIEVRRPSRLIVPADLRVPQIAARLESLGALARLTLDISPATPHAVSQEGQRLVVRFEADALDASLPPSTVPDLVADVRAGDTANTLIVDLGPRFASFRTTDSPGDRGGGRLVI